MTDLSIAMAPSVSMLDELTRRWRSAVKLHHTTPNIQSRRTELAATKGSVSTDSSKLDKVRLKTNLLLGVSK